MWTTLDLVDCCILIFRGNLFCETFLDYVFERCDMVFLEYGVLEEFIFREELCAPLGIYLQATSNFDYERANELDNVLPHTL